MTVPRSFRLRAACVLRHMALVLAVLAAPVIARAQTTVTLSQPGTQLTDDVTIRGGAYASVNLAADDTLTTKTSADISNTRRVLLKFDTSSTIPAGQPVSKATLTLTLKSSGSASPRRIATFWITRSFLESSATWTEYRAGAAWATSGGDLGPMAGYADVGTSPGAAVSFDVTSLVQDAVSGSNGTRWTRIALADIGSANNESLRNFYSSRASNASYRPRLTVTYGSGSGGGSGTSVRFMQYNTHHGVGEDGAYNLDRIANVIVAQGADVVSLNEVMYNSTYGSGEDQPATYKRLLQQKTGQTWYSVYARMDGNWNSTGWAEGNQLLSRIPFTGTAKHALSNDRSVAQATIVVNGRTVNVFSTHVDYDNASWRTQQINQLIAWVTTFGATRVVIGDFNNNPGSSDYQLMTAKCYDEWTEGVKLGVASSPSGSTGLTHGGSRFDYVWLWKGDPGLTLTRILVPNLGAAGTKPSDHDPVVGTFTIE